MAPSFFKKIKAKIEHKQPPEPTPETKDHSSAPSKAGSSRDEEVPKKEEPPLTLQERLWNTAYDGLKADQPDTVETYETLLSGELHKDGDKPDDSAPAENEIGSNRETRRGQMVQLVNVGLARTQKEAKIKGGIDEASNAIFAVKGVMDKAVTASPEAAVAWVGVCFALEILSNPITEARINRGGIAYVVSRMDWYWNLAGLLLEENKGEDALDGLRGELEKHIIQLYQKLLLFQMKSICIYFKNRLAVLARDMFKLDDWDGQLQGIKDAELAVEKDSNQYSTEKMKSYLQDLSISGRSQEKQLQDVTLAIRDQTAQQGKRHQDEKDEQCMRDLRITDPRDDKTRIQDTKGGLLRDSYRWVLDHKDFQEWRTDPESRLLWIKAAPGKGKTMLLCGIIDELESGSTMPLSYFFCQATETRLSDATAVLRGLIYSLADRNPSLIAHVREAYDQAGKQLFEDSNAWQALTKIFSAMLDDSVLADAVLVIDALDECLKNLPQLLDLIVKTSSSSKAKWIVSSRDWPNIAEKLDRATQKSTLSLELNADSISTAVQWYIKHQVESLSDEKAYDDETREAVESHLTKNANDTFLWVALVCEELRNASSWEAMDIIEEVPVGLEDLYARMIQQIQKLRVQSAEMCRAILSTIILAREPLRVEEIAHLSGLPPNMRKSNTQLGKVTGMCGSFLTIREDTVYIVHQSAKDFLSAHEFLFPHGSGDHHWLLFERSLEQLSKVLVRNMYKLPYPGYTIDKVSSPDPDPLVSVRYCSIYWVDHLDKSGVATGSKIKDDGIIHKFIKEKFLYWLEALSLLRYMPRATVELWHLLLVVEGCDAPELKKLLQDARRFLMSQRAAIEAAPLQVYVSALVSSPTGSLVRQLFKKEEPSWVTHKPAVDQEWDACLQTFEIQATHTDSGAVLAFMPFSPVDRQLVSCCEDDTLKIWNTMTGECLQTFEGHTDWVLCVAVLMDGKQIASGAEDASVRIWDSDTGACLRILEGHEDRVSSVVASQDSRLIASSSYDYVFKVWSVSTGECLHTVSTNYERVASLAFSADGTKLATCSARIIEIWDTSGDSLPCLHTFEVEDGLLSSIAYSPDSKRVAVGTSLSTVSVWDVDTGTVWKTLEGHQVVMGGIGAVAYSPNGKWIASGAEDANVIIWDAETGELLQKMNGHESRVLSVAFSADSCRLASGSADNTIRIWDLEMEMENKVEERPKHDDTITAMTISVDGSQIATGSMDNSVKVWDNSGNCKHTLKDHPTWLECVSFSLDGKRLASGSEGDVVKVWDLTTEACLWTLDVGFYKISSVAFSADGSKLAACFEKIKIWDVHTGELLHTIEGHDDVVKTIAFANKGNNLTSGSDDGTIKTWDTDTGECLQTLEGHVDWVNLVALSNDDELLASVSEDDTLRIWDMTKGALIQKCELECKIEQLWFDPLIKTRLRTEYGHLDLDLSRIADQKSQEASLKPTFGGWGINGEVTWIVKDEKEMFWLPPTHRPAAFHSREPIRVHGTTVALGGNTGRLTVMRFSD